jgi:alpha-glucosidase (family GH31 glycosyl hydrolase)
MFLDPLDNALLCSSCKYSVEKHSAGLILIDVRRTSPNRFEFAPRPISPMIRLLILLLLSPSILCADPLPYAEWAHYHMVWLHNSHSNQADIQSMFDTYLAYDIPVGTVNIDSRWETNFNTFVFDPQKFPNVRTMLDDFRNRGVHIIVWMTSFVNTDSPNYQYAQEHGFLFNKTLKWWHGEGRLLDYFNPDAVQWWHGQIKQLIDTVGPIHAFKVGVPLLRRHPSIVSFVQADESDRFIEKLHDPRVTWLRYRTAYYNDSFNVLRQLIGPEALLMSRPVDNDVEWSPKDVVFMGWVGDEDATYEGLKTALRYMLESGRRGYIGFGSDIGGYDANERIKPNGRTKELFLRWTAVGALSSFMENGGEGEHLPWKFDNETVDIYRMWVRLHYAFVPYLYTAGTVAALSRNGTLMKPCDDFECLLTYAYFLGPSIYVVPVPRDPKPEQRQRIWLPRSDSGHWISFFNTSLIYPAHSFIDEDTSRLDRIPLYVQQGTLMPTYDLERSAALDAYRFILWGATRSTTTHKTNALLYTRDGQQWSLELNHLRKRLTTRFIRWYRSSDNPQLTMNNYTWQWCQYVDQQMRCSSRVIPLQDNSSLELFDLV